MRRFLAVVALFFVAAGCTTRIGDFTLMSTKNLGVTPRPLSQQVRGEDCVHQILGIPIGSLNPNLDEAVDRAIAKVPGGNGMTDVSMHQDVLALPFYGRVCVRVDGAVVSFQPPTSR